MSLAEQRRLFVQRWWSLIAEMMERTQARRLQPHYVEAFFREAFQRLGGTARQREPQRYEITHVSAPIRQRDQVIGVGEPVLHRYERLEHIGLISRRTDQARRKRHHDHPLAASASVHASP